MDNELKAKIKPEVSVIFGLIVDTADQHPDGEGFEFDAHLHAEFYEHGADIAKALEQAFPNAEIFASVDIEARPESLKISVFYPPRYVVDHQDGRWFVDSPIHDCWYFETTDEGSAKALANFFNTAPHVRNLHRLCTKVGMDRDSLKLWLLDLRGKGIDVTAFAHKGTGVFEKNNVLN